MDRSLFLRTLHVLPTLVEHKVRHIALLIAEELHFRIYDFQEKLRFQFGKQRELALSGRLRHQLTTFKGHHNIEASLGLTARRPRDVGQGGEARVAVRSSVP